MMTLITKSISAFIFPARLTLHITPTTSLLTIAIWLRAFRVLLLVSAGVAFGCLLYKELNYNIIGPWAFPALTPVFIVVSLYLSAHS